MRKALEVLNELEQSGVIAGYAIGGGVGAIFYMEPFLTFDLDIFVSLPQSGGGLLTLGPIYDDLRRRGYTLEGEIVRIEGAAVQFLPPYNSLVEEALESARAVEYLGVPTRVFRPEHLAAIMVQTGREKDRQRLVAFVHQAGMDQRLLGELLDRYDLRNRWNEWQI